MRSQGRSIGKPTLGLAAVITSFFYCLPLGRFSFGGFLSDIRAFDLVSAGFLLCCLPSLWQPMRQLARTRLEFLGSATLLLMLVWLSLFFTFAGGGMDVLLPALIRSARFTMYLLIAGFVAAAVDTPRQSRFLLKIFYLNVVVQAVIAFAQGLGWLPNLWPAYWLLNYGNIPVGTLSPHHKHIGVVMLLGISLSATYLRTSRSLLTRAGVLLAATVMLIVPILSGSRTAGLGFGAFVLAYLYAHRGHGLALMLAAAIGVSAITWLSADLLRDPVQEQIDRRVLRPVAAGGISRLYEDRTAVYAELSEMLSSNPRLLLTGTGFQGVSIYAGPTGGHNNYLHVLVELGVVGLIIYLKFLGMVLKALRLTAIRTRSGFEATVAKDVWAAFVAVLVTMLVGETLWAQYSMFTMTGQIMFLVGVASAPLAWHRETTARTVQHRQVLVPLRLREVRDHRRSQPCPAHTLVADNSVATTP